MGGSPGRRRRRTGKAPQTPLEWAIVLAFVVVIAAGAIYGKRILVRLGLWTERGDVANGGSCMRDGDCASGNCWRGQCEVKAARANGERCQSDDECISGACQQSRDPLTKICVGP